MAERKKPRGRKAADSMKVETPLTKEEKAIIHWVRKNVATKTTKFLHSHKVGKFDVNYKVTHQVSELGWVDSDLIDPLILPRLLPISL